MKNTLIANAWRTASLSLLYALSFSIQSVYAIELPFTRCFNNKMFLFEYIFIRIRKINLQKLHIIPYTHIWRLYYIYLLTAVCESKHCVAWNAVYYTFLIALLCHGTFSSSIFSTLILNRKYCGSFHITQFFDVVGFLTFSQKCFGVKKSDTKSKCNYPSLIRNFYHLVCRQFFI